MLVSLLLVSLPLLLPFLAHGVALLLPVAALASEPTGYPAGPYPVTVAPAPVPSAPCRVRVHRPERRVYPVPWLANARQSEGRFAPMRYRSAPDAMHGGADYLSRFGTVPSVY